MYLVNLYCHNVIAVNFFKRCTKYVMFLTMNQNLYNIASLTCRVADELIDICCTTHYDNIFRPPRIENP